MGEIESFNISDYKKVAGIYVFTNIVNNKKYVGATNDIKRRYMEHTSPKKTLNPKFQIYKAFNKYGIENFNFKVIEVITDISTIHDREKYWIATLKPRYNANKGGVGNLGFEVSDEVKKVLSDKGKEQWNRLTKEEKNNRIKNNLTGAKDGYVMPEEQKQRLREFRLGTKMSEDAKLRIGKSNQIAMIGNKSGNKIISSFKNGILIKTYPSLVDAAKEFSIHPSSITGALKGKWKHSAGFEWKYGN